MENFRKLGLSEKILNKIHSMGFTKPTEIQDKAIPLVLAGKDVIGQAATGSGKTLAFGLGVIQNMPPEKGIQMLVLTPTRELAEQVGVALRPFAEMHGLRISAVYGGVSINPQIDALRRADIVVGTPGRILDHLERRTLDLRHIKTLVLDEADRMLDMGFFDDVIKIVEQCPRERQTLLFSATFSQDIIHLARRHMKEPVHVAAESYVAKEKLVQHYYDVRSDLKFSLLVHLLSSEESNLVMVFCNTQRNTDFVARNLKALGINALAIHGGHSQSRRNQTMSIFSSDNEMQILVCTDVAARGLDIKDVSHIYNYDVPKDSDSYIHRIGRTARAGKEGIAISLVSDRDYDSFAKVMSNPDIKIERLEMPVIKKVQIKWIPHGREGGRFGGQGFRGRDSGRGFRGGQGRGFRGQDEGRRFDRSDSGKKIRGFRDRENRDEGGQRRDNRLGDRRGRSQGRGYSRGFSRGRFGRRR